MRVDLRRRTRIVCTLGPATESAPVVENLVRAGMNIARLNLSHGDEEQHVALIGNVREAAAKLDVPVAIMLDLPGPRYRTGELQSGRVNLKKGARFVLTTRPVPGDDREVSLAPPDLVRDVAPGNEILLDDGAIRLVVKQKTDTDLVCSVAQGGALRPRRGIAAPGVKLSAPFINEKMERQLRFAMAQRVEFIALSFVGKARDVTEVRSLLSKQGEPPPLISKIERREAVRNFDSVLSVSDGIMVARGDLGLDISLEKVPLVQKDCIRKSNRRGKPVITATQMLESMVQSPRPTRAEVADVANAVWDGTGAVMLSAETAIGRFPVEAVNVMCRVAREIEAGLPYEHRLAQRGGDLEPETDDAIAYDACGTAHQLGAKAIVAFTESGSTAWRVSKYRPRVPILALTPNEVVRRRLSLAWGVHPYLSSRISTVDDLFAAGRSLALQAGAAREGDLVVITGGVPIGVPGTTNLLKVEKV